MVGLGLGLGLARARVGLGAHLGKAREQPVVVHRVAHRTAHHDGAPLAKVLLRSVRLEASEPPRLAGGHLVRGEVRGDLGEI